MSDFTKNLAGAGTNIGTVAVGVFGGGFAQKQFSFLQTKIGQFVLIAIGILMYMYMKSNIVKGIATGIAVSGGMGLISSMGLGDVDGLNGIDGGVGQIVQDENGLVYMIDGLGNLEPYELPMVETEGEPVNGNEEALAGWNDNVKALAWA